MAIRDYQNVIYTDDQGNQFAYKIAADVFAQVGASTQPKVGGADLAPANASLPPMPANLRPRYVICTRPNESNRRVVCLTKTADLFELTETSINLPVYGSAAAAAFTAYSPQGEKKRRKNPNS